MLASEKRDVEELENPWTRLVLFLSGQLATRESKEKREYDAALAETLRLGNLNAQIQAVMPSVGHPSSARGQAIRKALLACNRPDAVSLGGPGLGELWETVARGERFRMLSKKAHELWQQLRARESEARRARIERGFSWLTHEVEQVEQLDLVEVLDAGPTPRAIRLVRDSLRMRSARVTGELESRLRRLYRQDRYPWLDEFGSSGRTGIQSLESGVHSLAWLRDQS